MSNERGKSNGEKKIKTGHIKKCGIYDVEIASIQLIVQLVEEKRVHPLSLKETPARHAMI
jgi:hypothetical protein